MTSWADAIDAWTISIQAAGRAPRSIRLYRYHLLRVSRAVPKGPGAVTTADLRQILATPGWSPETRKSNRTTFVVFFRWLTAEGLIDDDPAARLDPVSVPAGIPRPAPEDVIARALAEADTRVRAMIMLAAFAGLRCCEIAGVHTDDWDGEGLYVTGKGGKRRYIPVVRDDVKALLRQAKRGYLFPGKIDGHRAHLSRAPRRLDRPHAPPSMRHQDVRRHPRPPRRRRRPRPRPPRDDPALRPAARRLPARRHRRCRVTSTENICATIILRAAQARSGSWSTLASPAGTRT